MYMAVKKEVKVRGLLSRKKARYGKSVKSVDSDDENEEDVKRPSTQPIIGKLYMLT